MCNTVGDICEELDAECPRSGRTRRLEEVGNH